ncbi:hypothetical protein HHI36_002911 [Cryptolaemus montrouzieri]|uniref:Uncharacterized protein n=1 Tax=Cryptolaemus montrouzieri TaxID=559131 RepID=A0ABD2PBV7_9CUCU
MWQNTVRKSFINHLQENFENRELLRNTTPKMFYNSLTLYSCFFTNLRKIHLKGYPSIETVAITGFLDMLLEYSDPTDIKMFANLVCENCGILIKLYEEKNTNLLEVLNKLKLRICDNSLPKNQKLLLFFAWDLIRHKYNISEEDLVFYRNNLGEDDIKNILIRYNYLHKLDIECPEVKNGKNTEEQKNNTSLEDENFVNHSVKLQPTNQVTNNHLEENALNHSRNVFSQQNISACENLHMNSGVSNNQPYSSKFKDDTSTQNDNWDCRAEQISKPMKSFNINGNKELHSKNVHRNTNENQGDKVGRPILGIGARLKRN